MRYSFKEAESRQESDSRQRSCILDEFSRVGVRDRRQDCGRNKSVDRY
jgi:hypothetical protein